MLIVNNAMIAIATAHNSLMDAASTDDQVTVACCQILAVLLVPIRWKTMISAEIPRTTVSMISATAPILLMMNINAQTVSKSKKDVANLAENSKNKEHHQMEEQRLVEELMADTAQTKINLAHHMLKTTTVIPVTKVLAF